MLLNLTRPYRKVTLAFLARELALTEPEVEELLVDLILDDRLAAHIDQTTGHVVLGAGTSAAGASGGDRAQQHLNSIAKWAEALATANESFGSRLMQ